MLSPEVALLVRGLSVYGVLDIVLCLEIRDFDCGRGSRFVEISSWLSRSQLPLR